jgi:hypothetical protein
MEKSSGNIPWLPEHALIIKLIITNNIERYFLIFLS